MTTDFDHQAVTYAGPWQFFGRDIDPTLPPPHRLRNEDNEDGEFDLGPTFSEDKTWWFPPGPRYHRDDPPVGKDWAADSADVPEFEPLLRRQDERSARWVVLRAHYRWPEDEELNSRPRRRLWSQIYGWLVQPGDGRHSSHTLRNAPSWGDGCRKPVSTPMPRISANCRGRQLTSTLTSGRRSGARESADLDQGLSGVVGVSLEGNVLDCSINEGVSAWFPSLVLFKEGKLTWVPGTREWCTPDGVSVARYFEGDGHMSLLVREGWLKRTLKKRVTRWCLDGWVKSGLLPLGRLMVWSATGRKSTESRHLPGIDGNLVSVDWSDVRPVT